MFRLGLNFFGLKYLSDVSLGPKFRLRPRFFFLAVLLGLLFSSVKIEKKYIWALFRKIQKNIQSQELSPRSLFPDLVGPNQFQELTPHRSYAVQSHLSSLLKQNVENNKKVIFLLVQSKSIPTLSKTRLFRFGCVGMLVEITVGCSAMSNA